MGQKDDLYYFSAYDSTLFGVKTSTGKVIIPPIYGGHLANAGEKITDREILLIDKDAVTDTMGYDYRYKIFDRNGNLLYVPYWYDNGADYYVEGLRRFVENGKMGFADHNGKKVIPAKYNMVEPFYRGNALVCLDCKYVHFNDNDDDHCCGYVGSRYTIINRTGAIVHELKEKLPYGLNDSILTALNLIQPAAATELSLTHTLEKIKEVQDLSKQNDGNICAVVAERPAEKNGYYLIVFRIKESYSFGDLSFLIKPDGKTILHLDNYGNIETLAAWRKKQ
ncbi:MAG: repeat-containing protein [Flavipsychrobacter sp.]|jgi:hypothetical protein|nr:repeat-containing protein [Flavipsychrobacter sp.]